MGYDCTSYLPSKTNIADLREYLKLLGYVQIEKDFFYFFDLENYSSLSGIRLSISKEKDEMRVWMHVQAWCSKADIDTLNSTLRHLRKRFGGYFISDTGKGRFIRHNGPNREKAEGGCYLAYYRFENSMKAIDLYLHTIQFSASFPPIGAFPEIDQMNPIILSSNLLVPFLVSIVEDFYKSSYIALLKYSNSEKRLSIFRNARLNPEELLRIGHKESSLEDAVARTMSFQNIHKIATYFKELDKNLDLASTLRKPYRRRKETLYQSLDNFFTQRHSLIHQNQMRLDYTKENLERDIVNIEEIIRRSYALFIRTYNWHPVQPAYSSEISG